MRGTYIPINISLLPLIVIGWQTQVSPPIMFMPQTAPSGWGPFLLLVPYKFSGVPSVNKHCELPESQNTLIVLCLPGMLQNRNIEGSVKLVIKSSPTGERFLSLTMISAGGNPASGILSASSLVVLMSMILGCWA